MLIPSHEVQQQREQPYFSQPPQLIFSCRLDGREAAVPRVMHRHSDRVELVFISRGSGEYIVDGVHYHLRAGELIIFRKDVPHEELPASAPDTIIFSAGLSRGRLRDAQRDPFTDPRQPVCFHSGIFGESIRTLFERLTVEKQQSVFNQLLHDVINAWDMHAAIDGGVTPTDDITLGRRIRDYIDRNFYRELTLNHIADALRMNVFYMSHAFKKCCGMTPKHYLLRRRIGEAQSLLIATDYSIGDIAVLVGYINNATFHRTFKVVVGVTPSAYRKRLKKTVMPADKNFSRHNECMQNYQV